MPRRPRRPHGREALDGSAEERGWGIPTDQLGGFSSGTWTQLLTAVGAVSDEEVTDPYAQHWAIYACVNARARAIASVPFRLWNGPGDKASEITSGPLFDVLQNPHPLLDSRLLWALTSVYRDLYGEAFWLLHRRSGDSMVPMDGGYGDPIPPPDEIAVVPGTRISIDPDRRTGLPALFRYSSGNADAGPEEYPPASVVPFIALGSKGNPLRGTGPAEAVARRIEVDFAAERLEIEAAKNGGFPSTIISSSSEHLTERQIDQVDERLRARMSNPDRHRRPMVLPHGFALQTPGWSPGDMEFPEARKWSLDAIMAAFGVTKPILGITDDVNRANAREAKAVFWEDTIVPQQREIATTVDTRLLRRVRVGRGSSVVVGSFDISEVEALSESLTEKIERFKMLRELGLKPAKAAELANWEVDFSDDDFEAPKPPPPQAPPDEPDEPEPEDESKAAPKAVERNLAPDALDKARTRFEALTDPLEAAIAAAAQSVQGAYLEAVTTKLRQAPERAKRARNVTARAITDQGEPSEALLAEIEKLALPLLASWVERAQEALSPELANAFFAGVASVAEELGIESLVAATDPAAIAFLQAKEVKLAEGVMSTLAQDIQQTIAKALATGDDFTIGTLSQEIEARLEELIDEVGIMRDRLPERAQRIARTESTASTNGGRVAQMRAGGITEHTWVASMDVATRDSHADLNGKRVVIGQPFKPGLRWPGDPAAPASEVINCRCSVVPNSAILDDLIDD